MKYYEKKILTSLFVITSMYYKDAPIVVHDPFKYSWNQIVNQRQEETPKTPRPKR